MSQFYCVNHTNKGQTGSVLQTLLFKKDATLEIFLSFLRNLNCIFSNKTNIILRLFLCISLLFQPLFWTSGQVQAQEYVPICIDQEFDLSTGEFGPVDPSLCGEGKRMGTGKKGDDGPGSGYSEGITSKEKSDDTFDNNSWVTNPSSPMHIPLREWSNNLTTKAQSLLDEMRVATLLNQKINNDYFLNTALPKIFSDVGEELFNDLEENFFSKNILNEQILKQITEYIKSKNILSQVKEQVDNQFDNRVSSNTKRIYNKVATYTIGIAVAKQINHFALEQLIKNKMSELGQLFSNREENSDWMQKVNQVIRSVETELNSSLYKQQPIGKFKDYYGVENGIEKASQQVEKALYNTAYQLAGVHILGSASKKMEQNSTTLTQTVTNSVQLTRYTHFPSVLSASTPEALYAKEVSSVVHRHIQTRYDRKDLAVLKDKGLGQPAEEPYRFKSPEGAFLEKTQELYEKLKQANPAHEQGIKAREIGLVAVEVADEEYAQGHEARAKLAYSIGEGMADITLGVLPYVGVAKDVYEAITGRHLLTGRVLTGLERSVSFLGIAVSTISGGVVSSGSMRLALTKTENVLGKINTKLWDKYLKGVSDSEVARLFKKYPKKLFKIIENLGFKTKQGVYSALYFVKRAFTSSFVRMEEVTKILKFVDRAGIENYTQSLDDLKKAGVALPKIGEEFLAKQLRFQKEVLGVGQALTKADLMRMGRVYSNYYKNMNQVSPATFKGKVWRGVKKTGQDKTGVVVFKNSPQGVFDLPVGAPRYISRRYSIPEEEAIYTSLSRRTAVMEIRSSGRKKILINKQIERLYHIDSKDIEVDKVLDLTKQDTRDLFKLNGKALIQKDITQNLNKYPKAYQLPQIIGHIAKRKGFKAIKAPSAPDDTGINIISFKELK